MSLIQLATTSESAQSLVVGRFINDLRWLHAELERHQNLARSMDEKIVAMSAENAKLKKLLKRVYEQNRLLDKENRRLRQEGGRGEKTPAQIEYVSRSDSHDIPPLKSVSELNESKKNAKASKKPSPPKVLRKARRAFRSVLPRPTREEPNPIVP